MILPALMAAASQGTFNRKPALPYYLLRAHRVGDEREPFSHPIFIDPDHPGGVAGGIADGMYAEVVTPSMMTVQKATPPEQEDEKPRKPKKPKWNPPRETDEFIEKYKSWTYHALRNRVKDVAPGTVLYGISRSDCGRILSEKEVPP